MAGTNVNYALVIAGVGVALLLIVLVVGAVVNHSMTYRQGAAPSYFTMGGAGPAAQQYAGQASGYITVTATGIAYGTPDQEQISVTINGTGSSAAQASQSISATLSTFNSTIRPFVNGNLSDLQTDSYSLSKQWNRSIYTAEEGITITLPNVVNATPAIGALSGIPNVYVNGASAVFSSGESSSLRVQALRNALANATTQATALAGTGVVQHNMTVSSYTFYPVGASYPVSVAVDASGGFQSTAPSPIVYVGRSAVQESVTVQFSYSR